MTADKQIDKLADFIMKEIPGEPSKDAGVIDTAIRIIRKQNEKLEKLWELHKLTETLLKV